MDTSETNCSVKPVSNVIAPLTTPPSVAIALHPLVIMNISEHWTRVRSQTGKNTKVYGALLGRQKGRNTELCTSFEMKMNPIPEDESNEDIDLEFLNTNISQFKQVFSDLDFLGWYTTGGTPVERDIVLHKQICTINESPVLLKLDPFGKHTDLPVNIYESVIDLINGDVKMLFIELEYTLATEEAERIGVDHICQHSHSSTMVQSAVADHLNAQYSAITLLNNRIRVIYEYVKAVKENKDVKKNNEILREIQSLCHRLPVINSPNFYKEFYTLYNDVTWIAYLGVIMQGSNTLNQISKMPVIMFIIDNSASMNQMTYLGTSYLDLAKSAIENFLKIRSRDQINSRNDRYMLLTLDEPPLNIKVGWRENMTIFTNELKNLKALGLTNINPVLKQAFDLLNINRLSSGMDTFGLGRCPFYLEPSLIILITDGGSLMNINSTYDELNLPLTNSPLGSELIIEPFRWDQRFFLISLNMGSIPNQETNQNTFIPYATYSPINSMCEVTGGRSYLISTQRMLYQCLESLVSKIQAGVVINFEKFGNDPPYMKGDEVTDRLWEKCKKMIFIPKNPQTKGYIIGHWPIPEDFWLNINSANLPKRTAHPVVKFKCDISEPMAIDEIPFDKYELEPSPLTQFILERRQPNVAWQCFVPNSGSKPNDLGFPFGYLKASSNLMSVNLFVMPYNYPMLFQLITELFQTLKLKPTKAWTDKFDFYLKHTPPYYYGPLRRVLSKKGLQHLIPENLENFLSVQVQIYLKKVKAQAKIAFDQVCAHPSIQIETLNLLSNNPNSILFKRQQAESYPESKEFNNWLQSHLDTNRAEMIRQQFNDFNNFQLCVKEKRKTKPVLFKEPNEIPRNKLIDTLQKMRTNIMTKFKPSDEDDLHSVPIQDMGNYHEYLKNQAQPLRELENQLVRQHMFGNPFKLVSKDQKNSMFGADEIDEVFEESAENSNQKSQIQQPTAVKRSSIGGPASKRRGVKGPLSRRINYLKNLYTQNSSSSSTISDSDIEFLDETSSSVSSQISTESSFASEFNENKLHTYVEPDVGNLNDFNDIPTVVDVEMQSYESNEEVKFTLGEPQTTAAPAAPLRPLSAISLVSSSSASNEIDFNLLSSSSSSLCDNYLEQSYIQLKILCIEQIKKPGKDHSKLFQLINESQLTLRMKQFLIRELAYETNRLKRTSLIQLLIKFSNLLNQLAITNRSTSSNLRQTPKPEVITID